MQLTTVGTSSLAGHHYVYIAWKVRCVLSPSITLKDAVKMRSYIANHKCTLVAGIPIETANHVQTTFAKVGVEVEVKASSIQNPMLLLPHAETTWEWRLLGIKKAT